jgi:hypothetical protein
MDVIVDLEGTLADCTHCLHHIRSGRRKNWGAFFAACHLDTPNPVVPALVKALAKENRLIFCSGRPERTRKASESGSSTTSASKSPPSICGRTKTVEPTHREGELLARIRSDGFDPAVAIDDRQRVVQMWPREGLVCAQVAEGNFENHTGG